MTSILRVQGLSKRFGGLQAINNVNFTVENGKIVCEEFLYDEAELVMANKLAGLDD